MSPPVWMQREHEMVRRVMLRLVERDWVLAEIGRVWGVTRQRVFQYVGRMGRHYGRRPRLR